MIGGSRKMKIMNKIKQHNNLEMKCKKSQTTHSLTVED